MRLSQIAKHYGLKVTHINKNNVKRVTEKFDIDKSTIKNNCFIFENEHIIIGLYDDYELKMATFFHEIGHTLISENFEKLVNYDNLLIEYEAWIKGLKEAKKHNIYFTGKTFKYILKSLDTYYEDAVRSYTKRSSKWHRKNS